MLKYLVVLLDDTSTSFCHYEVEKKEPHLLPLDDLRRAILWGMKENLMIQFVLPDYPLPLEYWQEMQIIDHSIIVSSEARYEENVPKEVFYQEPDVVVFHSLPALQACRLSKEGTYLLRISKETFFQSYKEIGKVLGKVARLNVVFTDADTFSDEDFEQYKKALSELSDTIKELFLQGEKPQCNLLTDRLMLKKMNNCGAGDHTLTLAPDGKFYICPAFYQADGKIDIGETYNVGSLDDGVKMPNPQLYKLNFAPLCRECDAYHCRRCVWLNRKTTMEVNTPSHEQCVLSHLERNASRKLLLSLREKGQFLPDVEIEEKEYLDPFEGKDKW